MNDEVSDLLERFREDRLTPGEWIRLNEMLEQPEARAALRRDWFLEAALPQSLAASAVPIPAPSQPRGEEPALGALLLWARASFAALALGCLTVTWAVWPPRTEISPDSDPAVIAQIILQNQLPDAP